MNDSITEATRRVDAAEKAAARINAMSRDELARSVFMNAYLSLMAFDNRRLLHGYDIRRIDQIVSLALGMNSTKELDEVSETTQPAPENHDTTLLDGVKELVDQLAAERAA